MMNIDLDVLKSSVFRKAECLLIIADSSRIVVVLLGLITNFLDVQAVAMALFSAILTINYAVSSWLSDKTKSVANSILSSFEMREGLGWKISSKEVSDWLADLPPRIRRRVASPSVHRYFASQLAPSYRKTLENLAESAWYTKHQAHRAGVIVIVLAVIILLASAFSLALIFQSLSTETHREAIAKAAITVISFLFAGGYVLRGIDYLLYSQSVDRIEEKSVLLCKQEEPEMADVIKLLRDYQVIRATAPLLPSWLWKTMESRLNAAWEESQRTECVK